MCNYVLYLWHFHSVFYTQCFRLVPAVNSVSGFNTLVTLRFQFGLSWLGSASLATLYEQHQQTTRQPCPGLFYVPVMKPFCSAQVTATKHRINTNHWNWVKRNRTIIGRSQRRQHVISSESHQSFRMLTKTTQKLMYWCTKWDQVPNSTQCVPSWLTELAVARYRDWWNSRGSCRVRNYLLYT